MKTRCAWVNDDPLYRVYHDKEWGVPVYDDRLLFEFLILESMQGGLSWLTILKKRENFRVCFDNFDAEKIARYSQRKVEKLLSDTGIIRNRLKIQAAIINAKAVLEIKKAHGSLSAYVWQFVKMPIKNHWQNVQQIPARSALSDTLSTALKKQGCKFIGSTICYAFMQAVGMVNDHTTDCFRYKIY